MSGVSFDVWKWQNTLRLYDNEEGREDTCDGSPGRQGLPCSARKDETERTGEAWRDW